MSATESVLQDKYGFSVSHYRSGDDRFSVGFLWKGDEGTELDLRERGYRLEDMGPVYAVFRSGPGA